MLCCLDSGCCWKVTVLRLRNTGMADLLDVLPCSTSGWRPAGKPHFEVRNLQRTLKNSSVPVPKTLLRMILNATLPRLLQRTLLVALPPELGQYLLACKQSVHIAGADLPPLCTMTTHSYNDQQCTAHHNVVHILKYSQTLRICMQHQMMGICPPCHSEGNLRMAWTLSVALTSHGVHRRGGHRWTCAELLRCGPVCSIAPWRRAQERHRGQAHGAAECHRPGSPQHAR